ncbi:MAG: DUF2062 domain-containing protein [Bacteroidia bacterium]
MQKLLQNFKTKFIQIFTYGLTPFQLALTISFGVTLGLFPFIGLTSVLCFIFAFIFKLNIVIIQLVNWLVAPLQLILLVPFYQLGNYFSINLFKTEVIKLEIELFAQSAFLQKIISLLNSQISAILGWLVICAPIGLVVYFISLFAYKQFLARRKKI